MTFRAVLVFGWLASVTLVFAVAFIGPSLIFGAYDLASMLHASSVCLAIAFVRNVVRPESVVLQAAGEYRKLANISLISGPISIIAAAILLLGYGPIASLYGVLMGDIIAAVLTRWQGKTWFDRFANRPA